MLLATTSKNLSVLLIGAIAFAASVVMGMALGIPVPQVHDEFSYLLAADTFAHGRVTNPTHPMWVHFETMHVIHQPTYMSKFMPAQGLFLALGQVLTGYPIVGVWLSMACMCAAICWMLHAWVPPRWAVLGGIFAIIHPYLGVGEYWAQSYWGGAVSATGGALLLGGLRYLSRKPRISFSVATGLGLAILANSRPYEGLVLSLPAGIGLFLLLSDNNSPGLAVTVRRIFLPLAVVGVISLTGMAFYNHRITGSVLRLPYLIHEETYSVSPLFIWENLPSVVPIYRHEIIREFHERFELPVYLAKHSVEGFFKVNFAALKLFVVLGLNVFVIPLICSFQGLAGWVWQDRWGRFAGLTYAIFVLGFMIQVHNMLHYWAPITALTYLFVLQSLRLWRIRDPRLGRLAPKVILLLAFIVMVVNTYQSVVAQDKLAPAWQRMKLLEHLSQGEDRHLIVVGYGKTHSFHNEWVFNEADIDGSKVIWARNMDLKENCRLVDYFKDRRIWSLEIDRDDVPVKLNPFPKEQCQF